MGMSVHIPHSLVGLPSSLIWLATAGEVMTWSSPRWTKVAFTVVVAPLFTVTFWQGGSVQPSTWVKETVWVPGASFSHVSPQESAIWPSTTTWVGTAGICVCATRNRPEAGGLGTPRLVPLRLPAASEGF